MKRHFKKILKPKKPFAEWAGEHNIELSEPSEQKNFALKHGLLSRWLSMAASLLIAVVLIIPFFFLPETPIIPEPAPAAPALPVEPEPPKSYSSQDVQTERMTLEEFYQIENLLFFRQEQLFEVGIAGADFPKEYDDLVLSYFIRDILVAASDELNAFHVNLTIRLYHHYEFYTIKDYENFQKQLKINNTEIEYKITQEGKIPHAYIYFSLQNGELEYFLQVTGYEGVTDITEETVQVLLNDLMTGR